jgi:hypothetical protein
VSRAAVSATGAGASWPVVNAVSGIALDALVAASFPQPRSIVAAVTAVMI